MLKDIKLEDILFLDVETVPQYETYPDVPDKMRKLWDRKASYLVKENETAESIYSRAGIYAEFGKIICISVGLIVNKNEERFFRIKSFSGDIENTILSDFSLMVNRFCQKPNAMLCAHNGKEFDFPYIARRMLINHISLPEILDVAGKKPWDVKFLDTMELWKFGDYKHYTSLDLLTSIFNIPSPKDDIDGSQVAEVFYKLGDIARIVKYCEKDVLSVAQLMLRYRNEDIIPDKNIEIIKE